MHKKEYYANAILDGQQFENHFENNYIKILSDQGFKGKFKIIEK